MKTEIVPKRKYSIISYISLLIGILCFLFVFITPTRIANAGNIVGDYITVALTVAGIILSVITMTKKTRRRELLFFHSYCPYHSLYFGSLRLF
ncbi:glucan phosphoethanolaminetransferase (alkaline phosphatase superfamily) [Bacillus sp. F9_6S_D1_P_5]